MGGIGLAVALLILGFIVFALISIMAYVEGRDTRESKYENEYWIPFAWMYDAGYTSTWRRKDVAQRNEERFAERAKKDGRVK